MDITALVTDEFIIHLQVSVVVGIIVFALIQKFKELPVIDKPVYLWLLNALLSMIAYPYALYYYEDIDKIGSIWVVLYTFIGATTIYETLKSQNIINYTPKTLNDTNAIEEAKDEEVTTNTIKEETTEEIAEISSNDTIIADEVKESVEVIEKEVFKPRLTAPTSSNKYYIHYSDGGYNYCIEISNGSVLPNCVGYACGRFNEIIGSMTYRHLSCNAEDMIERAESFYPDLEIGQTPKLGAMIVWSKGEVKTSKDGAGHVAIVEKINDDGSIEVSNSDYSGRTFYIRSVGSDYEIGGTYKFRGFIYNPATEGMAQGESSTDFPITYTIQKGDTLASIANQYYGSYDKEYYTYIADTNNISNPSVISVGQVIVIQEYRE